MRLIEALEKLNSFGEPVLTTKDVVQILSQPSSNTSQILCRLAAEKAYIIFKKGLWLIDVNLDPMIIASYITTPFPNYISLQTALYYHGMISQIPSNIYLVSLARAKIIKTSVAVYSVHHISSDFYFGYERYKDTDVFLASPEKSLIDYLYLSPAKSGIFSSFPELEIPKQFSAKKAKAIINKIPSKRTRNLVAKKFTSILGK